MREALILAGGRGTRLGALTDEAPKPLIEVGGEPFLEHLLWNLARHGIERVVISTGYLAQEFERFLAMRAGRAPRVELIAEDIPLGTGGAVANAAASLDGEVALVLNGDTYFDINYLDLALAVTDDTPVALALARVPDAGRYGAVALDGDHITAFTEKDAGGPGLVNAGVYAASTSFLRGLPAGSYSLERDVLVPLAAESHLAGREYAGRFVDMGTPESLAAAREAAGEWRRRGAVILDRDGVINVDHGHVSSPERFEWVPGAPEAVKAVNDAGLLAIVVTNQAGIAKGLYTHDTYRAFERWIAERLAEHGAHLDATYHCPHHPDVSGEYGGACDCRKPAPGMILAAIGEWGLDPARTVLLGDSPSDVQAARAAGIEGVLLGDADLLSTVRALIARVGLTP